MKIEGKITIWDIVYIVYILFFLFLMISNSVGGWLYISHFGFSIKQLLINILVTSSTLFMIWIVFTKILIFKIRKISN